MSLIKDYRRNYWFLRHFIKSNLYPFRPRSFGRQFIKRSLSCLGLQKGFRDFALAITYDCNLKCKHCSAHTLKASKNNSLTLDDYRNNVKQAAQYDILYWIITGGEPLLSPQLEDIIAILDPKKYNIAIQTNCTLMSAKKAHSLAKLGVSWVSTSLDSFTSEIHNDLRGNSEAYRKTLEGIKNAQQAGMMVLIAGLITHQNLRSPQTISLIKKANELGAMFIYNTIKPCGNYADRHDLVIRGDDRTYLNQLLQQFPNSSTDMECGRNQKGCQAGVEGLYISNYGEVLPCPFIQVSFGNVKKEPIETIINRMHKVEEFSSYQDRCLSGENLDFQNTIMKKIEKLEITKPVSYEHVYGDLDVV